MKNNIVLIEPAPSADYLSESLKKFGFRTKAIFKTITRDNAYFFFKQRVFDEHIVLKDFSREAFIAAARKEQPQYIINGSDDSASITDAVNAVLLPEFANDPTTSKNRYDKFLMQEQLQARQLPNIQQIKIDLNNIADIDHHSIRFPCFCKPIQGVCTIGAFKANNLEELSTGIKKLSQGTISHQKEYLIQEFIDADEYVVDTFSHKGKHHISSVQKYKKRFINGTPVYCYCEVVNDQVIWEECVGFVKKCLDILGLANGFCHTEIFQMTDGSFRLIEINPRISGVKGYYNKLAQLVNLFTQPELLVNYIKTPNKSIESTFSQKRGYGRFLCLYNFSEQPLKDPTDKLINLKSYQFHQLLKPVGSLPTSDSKNLTQTDLLVMLAHPNLNVLEEDTESIFNQEKSGVIL